MNSDNKNIDNKNINNKNIDNKNENNTTGRYIYIVFNILMSIVAIYLAKCNGLTVMNFLIALLFPYIYIIYSIIKYNNICKVK